MSALPGSWQRQGLPHHNNAGQAGRSLVSHLQVPWRRHASNSRLRQCHSFQLQRQIQRLRATQACQVGCTPFQLLTWGLRNQQRRSTVCTAGREPPSAYAVPPPANIAIFVSGGGSNYRAIHAATLDGRINGSIVAVVSDVPGCGGWEYAAEQAVTTLRYPAPKKGDASNALTTAELIATLQELHVQYICLAGYLKLVPAELVRQWPRAVLNIHPALLPAFGGKGYYGARVHAAVLASGARFSGASIHFVDEEYDTGPILAQRIVPVYPTDNPKQLAARVLQQEHLLYPEAVAALCGGRVSWREDGVPIIWSAH